MSLATVVVSALLAALLAYSAIRKLSHDPDVVSSYARAGVPEDQLDRLALVLLAGTAGLLAGMAWAPAGVVASGALVVYFLVAIAFHVRARDTAHAGTPVVLAVLSAATLALQLAV
jgi:DoxX-like family